MDTDDEKWIPYDNLMAYLFEIVKSIATKTKACLEMEAVWKINTI